jgi:Domain of unknown function (DUF4267)
MNGQHPMKMTRPLNILSFSGVLTGLVGLGIIFIGVREFLHPAVGARGFGVPLLDRGDGDLLAIKAVRDVVSGILALTFLGLRKRRSLACVLLVLALIPLLDGLVVLRHAAWKFTPVLLIHWGTAALMLFIVKLLRAK